LARTDFRAAASRRLAEAEGRELSPSIISLLSPEGSTKAVGVRHVPLDRITPNPHQPRMTFDEAALEELAASIREHGVLQPILVRPAPGGGYELIAGERRWRAARLAGLTEIAALIEQIDDDTALEISIIENLQREDLPPLDEALMYERMTTEHGYSLRKLAQKLGKDKGYIENRLRLADAPQEIKQLVSLRKDTLSHAYELLKVTDPKKRRKLAEQVASGELSLVKLRERIDGRPARTPALDRSDPQPEGRDDAEPAEPAEHADTAAPPRALGDDSLYAAKAHLAEALDELADVLRAQSLGEIADTDRANLAKYLTIAKLKLENAIAVVRAHDASRS
jgi:ParB family transcriptional regulator, chromosome partitioning protein